jgi:hypothetical protein
MPTIAETRYAPAPRPRESGLVRRSLRAARFALFTPYLGPRQELRASQFVAVGPPRRRSVVFLGDSITEGGLWDEWLWAVPVLNRGIGGEMSHQVLRRLDTAVASPLAVFLLIGTNDLTGGRSAASIVHDISAILDGIERRAPGTPVFVQSIMPRGARYRDDVLIVNRRLVELVASRPAHIQYLDLWPLLATERGTLRPEYTRDDLHLNGEGYRVWVELLRPHVLGAAARACP